MTGTERKKLLTMEDADLWIACEHDFRKGAGNGGQKINKTSSAVRLFHGETGIMVSCMESRSQSVNRHLALKKLRLRIACQERCATEENTEFLLDPAPAVSNRIYPLWIAALFDVLAEADWELKAAAEKLGTTRSHLTKQMQRDPALWREYLKQKTQNG